MAERRSDHCVTCARSVRCDRNRHTISREHMEDRPGFAEYVLERINIQEMAQNDVQYMCYRCWVAANRRQARYEQENNEEAAIVPEESHEISVPSYKRVANTSRRCMYSGCQHIDLHRVSFFLKVHLLVEHRVYIPQSARICSNHISANEWSSLYENGETIFTPDQLKDLIDTLRNAYKNKTFLDFENIETISPEELYFHTGLTHAQFGTIINETPSLSEELKKPKTALGAYLLKLRSGEPNVRIASQVGVSKRTLERLFNKVRDCLTREFVGRHLGGFRDSIYRDAEMRDIEMRGMNLICLQLKIGARLSCPIFKPTSHA
ncbi:uncharacterized protein LOC126381621 [Pectinophora gossypiella]|uniref:uncharacterized protein LOC126381621 n=1 Tax=Pectinophora gossypiella TaxID=13191 RepID=UPI00214E08BE|nr:uncharacterized protein LOC126381621 [Pectinophora gossypiella]